MTKKQYLRIKKQIDKLIDKLEEQAIKEGVNIASPRFLQLVERAKKKILAEWGISLAEYDRAIVEFEEVEERDGTARGLLEELQKNRFEGYKDHFNKFRGEIKERLFKSADFRKQFREEIERIISQH